LSELGDELLVAKRAWGLALPLRRNETSPHPAEQNGRRGDKKDSSSGRHRGHGVPPHVVYKHGTSDAAARSITQAHDRVADYRLMVGDRRTDLKRMIWVANEAGRMTTPVTDGARPCSILEARW
jgi:hypothetical protein